jgi:hypothetical protein
MGSLSSVRKRYATEVVHAAASITLPLDIPATRVTPETTAANTANPFNFESIELRALDKKALTLLGLTDADSGYEQLVCTRNVLHYYWRMRSWATYTGPVASFTDVRPQYTAQFLDALNVPNPVQTFHVGASAAGLTLNPLYLTYSGGSAGDDIMGQVAYTGVLGADAFFWQNYGQVELTAKKRSAPGAPWTDDNFAAGGAINVYEVSGTRRLKIWTQTSGATPTPRLYVDFVPGLPTATLDGFNNFGLGRFIQIEFIGTTVTPNLGIAGIEMRSYHGFNPTLSNDTMAAGWAIQTLDGWGEKSRTIQCISLSSTAMLVSNISAELSKNGTILMAQMPAADPVWDFARCLPQAIHSAAGRIALTRRTTMTLNDGGYGYIKPVNEIDLDYKDPTTIDFCTGAITGEGTDLAHFGDYLLFSLRIEVDPGLELVGSLFNVTVGSAAVYITTDNWLGGSVPQLTEQHVLDVINILKSVPQFSENPFHFRNVMDWLKKAGSTMLNLAPEVATIASAVMPELAPVAMPLAAAISAGRAMRRG